MSRILLVEGPDDEAFVKNLCRTYRIDIVCEIKICGGDDSILSYARSALKTGCSRLGIMADADSDISSRIDFLKTIAGESGYDAKGFDLKTVHSHPVRDQKFSCWIMPDNEGKGALETFYLNMIPKDDVLLSHAEQKLAELEKAEVNLYSISKREKALLHTWLAWQEEPGTRSGQAITKKYYKANTQSMIEFADWFRSLYLDDFSA